MKSLIIKKYSQNGKLLTGFTLIEVIVVMGVFLFIVGAAIGIFISVVQNQKKVLSEQQMISQVSYTEEYMSKALRMAAINPFNTCLSFSREPGGVNQLIYQLTRYDTGSGLFKGIMFFNQSSGAGGECQEFFLDNTTDASHPVLKELRAIDSSYFLDDNAVSITSPDLQIHNVKFSINGSAGSIISSNSCDSPALCGISGVDAIQPKVTILLNIFVPFGNQGTGTNCTADSDCTIVGQACYPATSKCTPTRTIQTTVSQRNLNVNNGQR